MSFTEKFVPLFNYFISIFFFTVKGLVNLKLLFQYLKMLDIKIYILIFQYSEV